MSKARAMMSDLAGRLPARVLPLIAAGVVIAVVALVLLRSAPPDVPAPAAAPVDAGATASPAGSAAATASGAGRATQQAGQVDLTDFRVTIPAGWQRRPDLEDQGPGTKLFVEGPTVGAGQVYIGIDVYPVPQGMTLEDFVTRYSANWAGAGAVTAKPATLCGKPARMLSLSDGKVEKVFLVTLRGDRGFAVGMFGPAGQTQANVKAFSGVVNTLQFFE